jgi:hypothetical protein
MIIDNNSPVAIYLRRAYNMSFEIIQIDSIFIDNNSGIIYMKLSEEPGNIRLHIFDIPRPVYEHVMELNISQ